ncbi:multidrug effflux MFS transporter [Jannaschia seohaensis]|uniref:DHA1 family bicyclomycin/chloramphenicol resistance-like MFS transporter n=1 Tax=Jannaschia seohaensis TaxID=475081 RepID=A0A2Y9B3M6_9RHOB|nr:multidrug effflux MFS transporter [Jannaschia seohaensis]PWJ14382.1 DHA1 family bicyclomycin/chloramphenicol resistance-like MFS transporter [Jannaschia seohaensis]SSA50088.1 MFS transporter, DHA1 family, bicyclomycin/chloramphenicol resistance protein [Jannaschia seohaensis]
MSPPTRALSQTEFVALTAMLIATIAFSIDSMLPALPEIGRELSPDAPNIAQLVIVSFVFGMGVGTLFAGPLSDAFGRKRLILAGAGLYCVAAIAAAFAQSLEALLVARVVQGIGASGPRVAAQAMVRDLYEGRAQARVASFIMMTFTLVPAMAPLIGSFIIAGFGWRGVFVSFLFFAGISSLWLTIRQPETLPPERRRPLDLPRLRAACREVLGIPNVRRAILVQTLVFGVLFGTISSIQPVYAEAFGRAESFPFWFALISILSAGASFLNAHLVGRLGMIWLIRRALVAHLAVSALLLAGWPVLSEALRFPVFLLWQVGAFSLAGLTIGNVQAIAMQPLGHVAGMASSVIASVSTIGAVALAAPIGLTFDGTPIPLVGGAAFCAATAFWLALCLEEDPVAAAA